MNDRIKLYYDFQILLMQKFGGISRYFYDLYSDLPKEQFDVKLPILGNENYYFSDFFSTRTIFNKLPRGHWKSNELYLKWVLNHAPKSDRCILHSTYYHPYLLKWYQGKLVTTIYDMTYEDFPEYFDNAKTVIDNKRSYMERADRIIAISDTTKQKILNLYPSIDPNRISVIYLCTDRDRFQNEPDKSFIEKFKQYEKYVLFVGRRDTYKNFDVLAEAMSCLMEDDKELHCICVGGGPIREDETDVFRKKGCGDRVIQLSASDSELGWLYRHARCFVFPSRGEGFGIPILESWENRCPVVLSDIPCFREIGGDACKYFKVDSVDSAMVVILEVLNQDADIMIKKGAARAQMFSKNKLIEQHISVYQSMV